LGTCDAVTSPGALAAGKPDLSLDGDKMPMDIDAALARVLIDLLQPAAPGSGRLAGST
jgi:hypothetical protein